VPYHDNKHRPDFQKKISFVHVRCSTFSKLSLTKFICYVVTAFLRRK
jgi:hypothetical protein